MFRPGNLGHIGRLGLVAASRPGLVAQALAILAKYGSAASLYLPGVGAINGITAGNWLDSAGTTAATVDNPSGLVVSSGKLFGPELVSNGDFLAGTSGWVGINGTTETVSGGALNFASATVGNPNASQPDFVTALTTYLISFTVLNRSSGGVFLSLYGASSQSITPTVTANGSYSFYVQAPADATGTFGIRLSTTSTLSITGVSVRESSTSHLIQPTTASKPILRLAGGVYAWDFVSSDSFTSTLTPGNAGFFCSCAQVNDSGVLRTLLGAGAGSDASSGVWLARAASNALTLQVGDGTTRNSVSAAYPVATNAVASAGWGGGAMFVGINGTETSGTKTVDCTSTNTMNIGVLTGTTNPMLGTIGATIIMPTVLPTATERATLRQFIASLSGVTM